MNRQRMLLFVPIIGFLLLSLLLWRGLSNDPTQLPSALLNKAVPAFDLPVLAAAENPADTPRATAEIFTGHVSLLNVWATWCVNCKQEHAFLNALKEQGVRIIGVNYKDETAAAEQWLRDLHNPYYLTVIDSDGRFGINLGVYGAPETYIVDKAGVIRYKHIGEVDAQVWERDLRPIMESLQ